MYRLQMIQQSFTMMAHCQLRTAKAQLIKLIELTEQAPDKNAYARALTIICILLEFMDDQEALLFYKERLSRIPMAILQEMEQELLDLTQQTKRTLKIQDVVDEIRDQWNSKYTQGYYYGTEANHFLVQTIAHDQLRNKKVLCLAEGQGRNAVHLAQKGALVTAVDISRKGLESGYELALERGVSDNIIWHEADLDVYRIEEQQWDYIVAIFMHLPPRIRNAILVSSFNGLVSGGKFIGVFYRPEQLLYNTGGPKDKQLLVTENDIAPLFPKTSSVNIQSIEKDVVEGKGHTGKAAVLEVIVQRT